MSNKTIKLSLVPADNRRLADLCGQYNAHLKQIEEYFEVEINHRGHLFHITGESAAVYAASKALQHIYEETKDRSTPMIPPKVHRLLKDIEFTRPSDNLSFTPLPPEKPFVKNISEKTTFKPTQREFITPTVEGEPPMIRTKRCVIKCSGENQAKYLNNILHHDINFAIGPAGTGKTYLAVACAVAALEREYIQRILLVRPAVEAGEKLGFLPGDLSQKVNPYLRPLYDALYEMMGVERVVKLIENDVIEVAPLAYMRGRTLNDAFIILDEGQNTTQEQMKMFLTRIGFGSKVIVTGDVTQVDLPKHIDSGLSHAMKVLKNVKGISFTYFDSKDAVRHPLVQSIIEAYEEIEHQTNSIVRKKMGE